MSAFILKIRFLGRLDVVKGTSEQTTKVLFCEGSIPSQTGVPPRNVVYNDVLLPINFFCDLALYIQLTFQHLLNSFSDNFFFERHF